MDGQGGTCYLTIKEEPLRDCDLGTDEGSSVQNLSAWRKALPCCSWCWEDLLGSHIDCTTEVNRKDLGSLSHLSLLQTSTEIKAGLSHGLWSSIITGALERMGKAEFET